MNGNILKWMALATCLQGAPALASEPTTIEVWHALGGMPEVAFGNAAQRYEEQTGNTLAVVQFVDEARLRDTLRVAVYAGAGPDVVVMNHTLAPEFRDAGALQPYCLPGECPECEGSVPPRWCAFASNGHYGDDPYGTFAATMIPELAMGPDRCVEEGCAECATESDPRPAYCDYVSSGLSRRDSTPDLDVLQAGFAQWMDFHDGAFPFGTPIWWDFLAVAPDRAKLEAYGFDSLATVADVEDFLAQDDGGAIAFFDGEYCGSVPYRFKVPGWVWPGPRPLHEADLVVAPISQLGALLGDIEGLEVADIEGHRSEIIVTGAFALSTTQHREAALDFVYELATPETQLEGASDGNLLPANNLAFESHAFAVPGTREAGVKGVLALPSP